MYQKKRNLPVVITIVAMIIILGILLVLNFVKNKSVKEPETTVLETELLEHEILLYKSNAASIEFNRAWLKREDETQVILSMKEDEMVTILVTPNAGKIFDHVTINESSNINNEISCLVNDASDKEKRINFVMPHADVIINFTFTEQETSFEIEKDNQETELLTETELETGQIENPYGLKLHGVTSDIIMAYNGQFDDQKFLQQLGDDLHMDKARSVYHAVTDVTFSTEPYEGDTDSNLLSYYIYFNDDPQWKIVSTYYRKEDTYVFTEPVEEAESERETSTKEDIVTSQPSGGTGTTSSTSGVTNSAGTSNQASETITTSFDILQVSKNLLTYCGDEEMFYQQTFDYVLKKGLTGSIVGTMREYKIDPDRKKAIFQISLNIGGSINGTYDKEKNTYQFAGL